MKKILFIAATFIAITGFTNFSSTEDGLRKQIADLENQLAELKK